LLTLRTVFSAITIVKIFKLGSLSFWFTLAWCIVGLFLLQAFYRQSFSPRPLIDIVEEFTCIMSESHQPLLTGPDHPDIVSNSTKSAQDEEPDVVSTAAVNDPFADYTVRLCQFNAFIRPPGITSNGNDYKSERLQYFIDHELDRFDVIAFQELFGFASSRRSRLIKAAYAKGFKYSVSSPRQCGAKLRIDGGLVIISRFPVVRASALTFDRGIYSDWLAAKGVLYAKIRVGGDQHLHLFNTHLQASYLHDYPMSDPAVQIRLKQLYALRRFIDAEMRDEAPNQLIILAGDLNVNARPINARDAERGESSVEYRAAMDILHGVGVHPSLVPGARYDEYVYASENKFLVEDLLYESNKVHPVTFADVKTDDNGELILDSYGQPIPKETKLTSRDALRGRARLDYLIALRRGEDPHSVAQGVTDPKRTRVEPFYIRKEHQSNMEVTQLSDHYGTSTVLEFK
jgi:endonuclease/exonuclease/phosphatase family metal-dependent hydrolase